MKDDDITFREEDSVDGFLGVLIDQKEDSSIHLTQKGLTERIIEALNLNDSDATTVETPCTGFLPLDEHGEDTHEEFSYRSIILSLDNSTTFKVIPAAISEWQPLKSLDMFIVRSALTN